MTPTSETEFDAAIADLEASLAEAKPEMRPMLEQQVRLMRQTREFARQAAQGAPDLKARRPALSPEMRQFFTPRPPAPLPAWLPDALTRAGLSEAMLRCPPGARVFASDDGVECRKPPAGLGGIPQPHGLALWFHRSGRLKAQRFYKHGLLRWAVSYHLTGGREHEGHYADEAPKEHREHGLVTGYAPGGTVVRQAEYDRGVIHGWSKLWEEDGFPVSASRYVAGRVIETVLPDGSRR